MRILFCGTPHFAVPTFIQLLAQPDIEIAAVITQPDRPRGRGRQISAPPVKEAAIAANVPVHQPEKIRSPEAWDLLQRLAPDCIVIIAYGQIIPASLLQIPKLGWINLHASLLPKYRGAAPINWAIANGETQTGLTTMRIDAGMDTGDMLLQEEIGITVKEACLAPLTFASHAYEGFHLLMPLYICRRWDGEVIAREGQNLAWVRANKLRDYRMPPADVPLIPHLIDLLM